MATILIVDDQPINRRFLMTLLGYTGHELIEAGDGAEALALARQRKPDLVITDILMPNMNGYEFVQNLRADAALTATPVIFYTATYRASEARLLGTACGVEHVLSKPSDPETILNTVHAALGMRISDTTTVAVQAALPDSSPEPTRLGEIGDKLAEHLSDLETVKRLIDELMQRGARLRAERDHLKNISQKFSENLAHLHTASGRLYTLVELGLALISEREPERMLSTFCLSAHKLVPCRVAAVGMLADNASALRYFFASGGEPEAQSVADAPSPQTGPFARVAHERRSLLLTRDEARGIAGLPPEHTPTSSILIVPIATTAHFWGFLYFVDRTGADGFDSSDERIALTLAAEAGLLYENFSLYDTVQQHAARLQLEVTARRQAEEEVRALNKVLELRVAERTRELEAANRELESFSYSVSHDLRAPLRAINGFARMLADDHGSGLPEDGQRQLRVIRDNAKRMDNLIRDLLDFSRLSRQSMKRQAVNTGELVRAALEAINGANARPNLDIRFRDLPECHADPALLKQVFVNLLANAVKYSSKREQAVVEVGCKEQTGERVYYVKDNGVGFNMLYADRLFRVFQRLHREEDYEGTGVGLAIVERVVHRHGGRVWAEGEPDKGATFYFTLGEPAGQSLPA